MRPGEERIKETADEPDALAASLQRGIRTLGDTFRWLAGAQGRRTSTLRRRIIMLNAAALIILIGGVFYFNLSRVSLIEERILSLTTQGKIIARALAESAAGGAEATHIDAETAAPALARLAGPTATRVRLYDRRGELQLDTRYLLPQNAIVTNRLPPPGDELWNFDWALRLYDLAVDLLPQRRYPPYTESLFGSGLAYGEVAEAIEGQVASAVRVNNQGELILSVAVPVQRLQYVLGVLFMSTEGGDIDAVLRAERTWLLQVSLVAVAVMVASSIFLARTIARPVRELADAAERVRRLPADREDIPDFTQRRDEIGDLSATLRDMTQALYNRIDAIEQFAADVAHEIKNPLTSLKSAVETFARAKDEKARARLMDVIIQDVDRINRLVSDISDASRLDAELAREKAHTIDLAQLIQTVASYYSRDGRAGVSVRVTIDLAKALYLRGLEGPLAQVFRNILDNAVSFSPAEGAVRLTLTRRGRLALITIDDDGPGIPEDNLGRVFDRFFTERPADHGFGNNSGLGLSISRQIVEMHGGTIEASNRRTRPDGPVEGARFIITLPVLEGT
ncbi:MAG: stimulus-sensing domain-containing protein [Alphaproteobacteria bacterium]|nr:stimulus-sensing domain-containing protein [Alphaproteobacteria bacterium]